MTERINRRDLIIQTATELFIEQGYAATSVRQISDAVGCTEAALYYHFKDGKRALLRAVVESKSPDFITVLEDCRQADTLPRLVLTFVNSMCTYCKEREKNIQWVISEYPNLSSDEKAIFHERHLEFHAELVKLFTPFVKDEHEAYGLVWMLICASFGYRQMFVTMELETLTKFSVDEFAEKAAYYLSR